MLLVYHMTFSVCCRSRAKSITIIHCPDYSILLKESINPCGVPYHNSYSSRLVHCYITLPQASNSLSFTHRFRTQLALANVSAEGRAESLESKWASLERKGWMPCSWRFRRDIQKHLILFCYCFFLFLAIFILLQCH